MRATYTKDHIKAFSGFSPPHPDRIRVKVQVPFTLSKHNKWQNNPVPRLSFRAK